MYIHMYVKCTTYYTDSRVSFSSSHAVEALTEYIILVSPPMLHPRSHLFSS